MVDMDFLSALFSGQTGTDDPARAGIAQIPLAEAALPPPIPGPFPPQIPPPPSAPPSPDADLRRQYDAAVAKYSQTEGKHGQGYYNSEQSGRPEPESFDQYRARWQSPTSQPGGAGDNQAPPRVLATLSNASPVQAPGGGDLPVNLIGPQTGPYAVMQQAAQNAQGGSQQPATPMQPPAPQPSGASTPTSYGPLMDRILRQIDNREKSSWSDNLLRFGLAAMAAGGKPGATTLGALGEGGLSALSAQDANRGQDLKALLTGAQATNALTESGLKGTQLDRLRTLPQTVASILNDTDKAPTGGGSSASNPAPGRVSSSMAVNASLPAEARALLDTIAGPESAGAYNVRYTPKGAAQFDSYAAHPNIAEKGPEGDSTAAGRYQIVKKTWDPVAQKLGLTDFSPQSQDLAAWQIAQDAYNKKTGGDLLGALREGKLPEVQSALRDSRQWDTANLRNYRANLAQYTASGGGEAPAGAGGGGTQTGGATGSPGTVGGVTLPAWVPPGKALALANAFAGVPGQEHIVSYYTGLAKPPEGFTWGPGGTQAAITGGPQDPATVGRAEAAKQQAKVGPDIAIATAHEQARVGPQTSINAAHEQSRADREMDVARYRANLETNPNALSYGNPAAGQAGPGITEPLQTPRGTIIPPLAAAAPIAGGTKYLEKRQEQWAKTEDDWSGALAHNKMAEQRALAIADALKKVESGSFETNKAEINASLKAVGIPEFVGKNDPADVQKILKNNFNAVLDQLKTFSSRPTQTEVQLASQNFANPNLQPEANRAIIGQTVGALRWENSMLHDWADAKRVGWRDPQDFQRAWSATNPIQPFVDQAEKDVGTLKGMAVPINDAVRSEANDAMRRGVPRDAIMDRLRSRGYDTRGF